MPRHVLPLSAATLTHFTIPQLPRAAGTGPVKKLWAKNEIDGKWAKSSFAQRTDRSERRKNLSDFERFKVLRLRKQVRFGKPEETEGLGTYMRPDSRLSRGDMGKYHITNTSSRLATRSRSLSPRFALPPRHR